MTMLSQMAGTLGTIVTSVGIASSLDYPLCQREACKYLLSGPMSGLPGWNRDAFERCEEAIRRRYRANFGNRPWLSVYNPASDVPGGPAEAEPHAYYMQRTLHVLTEHFHGTCGTLVDAVILLPGWERSRGAVTEAVVAHECGIDLVEWDGLPSVATEGDDAGACGRQRKSQITEYAGQAKRAIAALDVGTRLRLAILFGGDHAKNKVDENYFAGVYD